jgi:SsrA-binding protein
MSKAEKEKNQPPLASNRKARFNYEIVDTLEAGIVLTGTEIKSLVQGKSLITEAYASIEDGELWLVNSYIPEYTEASRFNHAPTRRRKLLVHKKQLSKLLLSVAREGMTLVPLKVYFNDKRKAKVELALARGKKNHDKREADKKRDWDREKARVLKAHG